ncbi:GNAT family N-acetyltransferase [Consotaella aegiceratis]|uniref:GNAT family N-acetyltransferase n=1 Tax=Consotaella aegiceratis TaxID=3097961 RepID=UPI002F42BBBB
MPPISLRRATIEDAVALADLHQATIGGTYRDVYAPTALEDWQSGHTPDRWRRRLAGESLFVLAEGDGRVLGCGGLTGNRTGVYVHPSAQRRGIARTVFAELERLARLRNVPTLELSAPQKAVPFYRSVGFVPIAPKRHDFANGEGIIVVDMRKVLSG